MSIKKVGLSIAALAFVLVLVPAAANAQGVLFVKNNRVGIGTDTPSDKLHVVVTGTGGATDALRLVNTNGTPQSRYVASGGAEWRIGVNPQGDFVMNEMQDPVPAELKVTKTGDLFVNGTGMTVPDYVFHEEYDLMPLSELAAFVRTNRHLPKINSAEDVKKAGGINLTVFPLQLLEKIEELTLYTIEQQQLISRVMAENADLQNRLAALEQQR